MTQTPDALKRPFSELERYAGWLAKDRASVAVRTAVHALGAAMEGGTDTSSLLLTLDNDIGRLPGSDMRKMLRRAAGEIRAVLEPTEIDVRDGEGL